MTPPKPSDTSEPMERCPHCTCAIWIPIPASLADACKGCGFVRVLDDGATYRGEPRYTRGATIQEWAQYLVNTRH